MTRIVTAEARALTIALTVATIFGLAAVGLIVLMGFVGFSGWFLAAAIVSAVVAVCIVAVTA